MEKSWKDRLKNRSKIEIEIKSNFEKQIYKEEGWDAEDITKEIEEAFHSAIFTFIENKITDNEDFEKEILEIMLEEENLLKNTNEFSQLGQISITISQADKPQIGEKE